MACCLNTSRILGRMRGIITEFQREDSKNERKCGGNDVKGYGECESRTNSL